MGRHADPGRRPPPRAREQRSVTLKEISDQTKISLRLLEALEDGRTQDTCPSRSSSKASSGPTPRSSAPRGPFPGGLPGRAGPRPETEAKPGVRPRNQAPAGSAGRAASRRRPLVAVLGAHPPGAPWPPLTSSSSSHARPPAGLPAAKRRRRGPGHRAARSGARGGRGRRAPRNTSPEPPASSWS